MLQTTSESLLTLPSNWILEPVQGKKPYRKNWTQTDIDRLSCLAELESGKATGLGLKLGKGLLAIDMDGESAAQLLTQLAGENSLIFLSHTTAWTSGRSGRKQYLLSVPESAWPRCRNVRIGTGIVGDDGKEECLEFRWLGTQSLLPPSIHPLTKKPYTWINNPLQTPPVLAPEWLIDINENWHIKYAGINEIDLVRFPSRLFPYFGRQMSVWLLARRFDLSRWVSDGKPKGSGIGKFTLTGASRILHLSKPRIRRLLSDAKKSGLIHNYLQKGEQITVFYTSLEKAIAIAGVDKLGPVAAVNIDELANIHILATEVEAQHLQRSSFYRQRQEEIQQIKAQGFDPEHKPTQLIKPSALHTSVQPAGVITKSGRFIGVKSGFRFYGGSQEAIAQSRGISPSTVSRHLSNRYRLAASPVRSFRQELSPIIKKQLVELIPVPKIIPPKICIEEGLFSMLGEWWKPHCNVYLLDHRLVSARRRRVHIEAQIDNGGLLVEKSVAGRFDNKFPLSVSKIRKKEGVPERRKEKAKKPGQGKAKTIMTQQ